MPNVAFLPEHYEFFLRSPECNQPPPALTATHIFPVVMDCVLSNCEAKQGPPPFSTSPSYAVRIRKVIYTECVRLLKTSY